MKIQIVVLTMMLTFSHFSFSDGESHNLSRILGTNNSYSQAFPTQPPLSRENKQDSINASRKIGSHIGGASGSLIGGSLGGIPGGLIGGSAGSEFGEDLGEKFIMKSFEINEHGTLDGIPIHQYPEPFRGF